MAERNGWASWAKAGIAAAAVAGGALCFVVGNVSAGSSERESIKTLAARNEARIDALDAKSSQACERLARVEAKLDSVLALLRESRRDAR